MKPVRNILLTLLSCLILAPVAVALYQFNEIKSLPLPVTTGELAMKGKSVTLVYNGGHNSCIRAPEAPEVKGNIWPEHYGEFQKTMAFAESETGERPRLIFTCIYLSPNDIFMVDTANESVDKYARMSLEEYFAYLDALPEEGVTLYMGHSYGAWITLQSALRHQRGQFALLTMDAISPIHCNYLGGLVQWLTQGSPAGCQQAPPDLLEDQLAHLSAQALYWLNAYQDSFPYIHSSPFAFADNKRVAGIGSSTSIFAIGDPENAHNELRVISSIWEQFRFRLGRL